MKISDENRKRGWTPELVEWAKTYRKDADRVNQSICVTQKHSYEVSLASLRRCRPMWYDLLQALPAEALELLYLDGEWKDITESPGKRSLSFRYRVRKGWQVGEWVDDKPEPTGGDLLDAIIEEHGVPCCLMIGDKMCFLHNDKDGDVWLSCNGGAAFRFEDGWVYVYVEHLLDPGEITRENISVVMTEAMRAAKDGE